MTYSLFRSDYRPNSPSVHDRTIQLKTLEIVLLRSDPVHTSKSTIEYEARIRNINTQTLDSFASSYASDPQTLESWERTIGQHWQAYHMKDQDPQRFVMNHAAHIRQDLEARNERLVAKYREEKDKFPRYYGRERVRAETRRHPATRAPYLPKNLSFVEKLKGFFGSVFGYA